MGSVIRNIFLEKSHAVAEARERAAQPTPDGSVAVAPRRTDAESEDREFHGPRPAVRSAF